MRLSERQRAVLIENNLESNRVTREAIRDALLALMKDRDYAAIRVTDIINKSGVSRSAFYRNYKAKDEVLMDLIDAATEDYQAIVAAVRRGDWETALRVVEDHAGDVRLFIKAGLEHRLLDEFNRLLPPEGDNPYRHIALNGVVYATVINWLRADPKADLQSAAAQIRAAVSALTENDESGEGT